MNKIELNRLSQVNNNEQNFLTALNDNLSRIQKAINDTLSRTGVAPNQMEQVLDMNGERIVNVGPAVEMTDVVTKQDIQNIIDAAEAAIARLDGLVEAAKIAVQTYANENIYPVLTAAVTAAENAKVAAEEARDAILNNPDIQELLENLDKIMELVHAMDGLQRIIDNMDELLAVAADLTNLDSIADNLGEILNASTYASQAATSASNAAQSAAEAARYAGAIIETTGDSGTLTAEQMAMLGPTTKISNDGEIFTMSNDDSSLDYVTFINGDVDSNDKMAFKTIYVNTSDGTWTKEDIAGGGSEVHDASESVKGIAMLATTEEATTGTDNTKIMTPAKVKAAIQAQSYNSLTPAQEVTLLSTGKYLNQIVPNGTNFIKSDGSLNKLQYSTPYITTTWTSGAITNGKYLDMVYAKGNLIATSANNSNVYVSTNNGATWTEITSIGNRANRMVVDESGNVYSFTEGSELGIKSTDGGLTWTQGTRSRSLYSCTSIAYGNGKWVACGKLDHYQGTSFGQGYSSDGLTYTAGNLENVMGSYNKTSVIYDPTYDRFVARSDRSNVICVSPTGQTWTAIGSTPNHTDIEMDLMCAGDGVLLYCLYNTKTCYRSTNGGATWTTLQDLPVSASWTYLKYIDGTFYLISVAGTTYLSYDNGDTWVRASASQAYDWVYPYMKDANTVYMYPRWSGTGGRSTFYTGAIHETHDQILKKLSYTTTEVNTALAAKQGVLTAGTGISIDPTTNTISATGGGGGAGWLTGTSDPTASTESLEGQRYLNTTSGKSFISTLTRTDTPQYTVVGSPTINSTYVMSNISNSNYVKMPSVWQPTGPWEVTLQYTPTGITGEWYKITGASNDFTGASFGLNSSGYPQVEATTNGASWQVNLIGTETLTPNTPYWFKYGWTGTQYYLKQSTDNVIYDTIATYTLSTNIRVNYPMYIGTTNVGGTIRYARGTMDLKYFKITENNSVAWEAVQNTETKVWKPLIYNQGTGSSAIAIAEGVATASGTRSVAIGYGSSAVYNNCIAIGYIATAGTAGTNMYCTAIGSSATATGSYSTAIGSSSQATAARTTSIGYSSRAIADNAVAIGYMARTGSSATGAVQLGQGTNNTANTLQFKSYTVVDANGVVPSERLGASGVIIGTTDPTTSTSAVAGQRYLNKNTGDSFVNSLTMVSPATTNYTTTGTVSVNSDYVATFASGAYLRPNINWNMSGASSWSIVFKFTMPSSVASSNGVCLMRIGETECMVFLNRNTPRIVSLGWNGSGVTVSWGQKYWYKLEYVSSTGKYNTYISTTETFPSTPSYSTSSPEYTPGNNVVAYIGGKADYETFTGSIDLSTMKWYKNGSLVWEAVTPPVYQGEWVKLAKASDLSDKQNTIPVLESLPAEPVEGQIYFITGSS